MKEIKTLLQSSLFWDVDKEKLNPYLNKQFIICRVMDRGDIKDVNVVLNYYNRQTLIETLTNARFIEKKTIAFFANYFDLSPTDFKAWKSESNIQWNL